MPYPDDPTIDAETILWRWIRPDVIVTDPKRPSGWRLSSQAFEDSKNGTPCSIALRDETWSAEEVLARFPNYSIAQLTAGTARDRGQAVLRWPDANMPGHAYLAGAKRKSVLRDLAKAGRWVAGPRNWDTDQPQD